MKQATDNRRRITGLGQVLASQGRRPSWVAEQMEVHPSLVTRWCNGERFATTEQVRYLAKLLGVRQSDLNPEAWT